MIPQDVLKKVKKIEIQTRKIVNEVFSGEYHSVFKGRGMEFSEVREYQYGDDIRMIDWNVTARTSTPFIKLMEEERELTVYFMIDNSASGLFGSVKQSKSEIAAEICSVLAFSALKNGDKIGLLSFTDKVEKYISPRKGKSYALQVVREILFGEHSSTGTDISGAMQFLSRVARKKSVIFVVSDFYNLDFYQPLKALSNKHDVILIQTIDPFDRSLPDMGMFSFRDPELMQTRVINTSDKNFRIHYENKNKERRNRLDMMAKKTKVDLINIHTDESYIEPLSIFFKRRGKMFR